MKKFLQLVGTLFFVWAGFAHAGPVATSCGAGEEQYFFNSIGSYSVTFSSCMAHNHAGTGDVMLSVYGQVKKGSDVWSIDGLIPLLGGNIYQDDDPHFFDPGLLLSFGGDQSILLTNLGTQDLYFRVGTSQFQKFIWSAGSVDLPPEPVSEPPMLALVALALVGMTLALAPSKRKQKPVIRLAYAS